jgi:hypothetical protein
VFGLGVCFGAGPMACAVAEDPQFRAFAGVAGVYTDSAKTREMMGPAYEPALARARAVAPGGSRNTVWFDHPTVINVKLETSSLGEIKDLGSSFRD